MWYVDGFDFLSCFTRYYARSSDKEKQNVSVERLSEWTDSSRAVCFIATKDRMYHHRSGKKQRLWRLCLEKINWRLMFV
jgi:hypothetical protein